MIRMSRELGRNDALWTLIEWRKWCCRAITRCGKSDKKVRRKKEDTRILELMRRHVTFS